MTRRRGPVRRLGLARPTTRRAVSEELGHHVDELADRLEEQGMDPGAARAEALRRMGDMEALQRELEGLATGEGGRWTMRDWIAGVLQDVRVTWRGLRRQPTFTWTLVLTLAVGIGAAGAVFSVVDAVLLRPLPYHEPDRIVEVDLAISGGMTLRGLRADQADTWLPAADFLEQKALWDRQSLVRTDGRDPEQLSATVVSPGLTDLLGVTMALGRGFLPEDATPGTRVAILTHDYWARLGSDPAILGTTLRLDDEPWTVVGVLPANFKYPVAGTDDLWIPLADDMTAAGHPLSSISVAARLPDGMSLAAAQERADALSASLAAEHPHDMGWATRLRPVTDWRANDDTAKGLWMAAGAVALMFLIALVNAVNLLLVRSRERQGEAALRQALGASGPILLRQVLVESLALSLVSGVFAVGFASAATSLIGRVAPREVTFGMVYGFGVEHRTVLMVFATTVAAGLLVGLLPAVTVARSRPTRGALHGSARDDRSSSRLRSALVALEVAVSVILLVGAGLLLRSFAALNAVDLGMDADRVAVAELTLPESRYPTGADRGAYVAEALERLRAIPGAVSAAAAQGVPPEGGGVSFGLEPQPEGGEPVEFDGLMPFVLAEPGYVSVLGTRLIDGRPLETGDVESGGVLIDRDLARLVFGSEQVAGRRFRLDSDGDWLTVVGVVDELRLGGPDDRTGSAALVYPMDLRTPPSYMGFVVRTDGDPAALLPAMRAALRAVDDVVPLRTLQTGERAAAAALTRPRFVVLLISVLAGIALLLAAVGLFGVLSYAITQRRREMGIRMALGAPRGTVRIGVLRWGMGLTLIGTVVGLGGAALLDDLLASLLFGVEPGDLGTTLGVTVSMLLVAGLACWLPAARATRVDPAEVLRQE